MCGFNLRHRLAVETHHQFHFSSDPCVDPCNGVANAEGVNFVDIWTAFAEVIRVAFRNAIDAGLEVFTAKWTRAEDDRASP